jgi:hypothetical protein
MRIAPTMRCATRTCAAALAASALLFSFSAGAVEVCDKTCVGPACAKNCVHEPNATVGRGERDKVIIEERTRRREPGVVIKEREHRPNVDIEVNR